MPTKYEIIPTQTRNGLLFVARAHYAKGGTCEAHCKTFAQATSWLEECYASHAEVDHYLTERGI